MTGELKGLLIGTIAGEYVGVVDKQISGVCPPSHIQTKENVSHEKLKVANAGDKQQKLSKPNPIATVFMPIELQQVPLPQVLEIVLGIFDGDREEVIVGDIVFDGVREGDIEGICIGVFEGDVVGIAVGGLVVGFSDGNIVGVTVGV